MDALQPIPATQASDIEAAKSVGAFLQRLWRASFQPVADLEVEAWVTEEPVGFDQRLSGAHLRLEMGKSWGKLFDCAWFRFCGRIPDSAAGRNVVALLDVNGELLVVDREGEPLRGLTPKASVFDRTLGEPGKIVLAVRSPAAGGEKLEIWADAGCNDLFGELPEEGRVRQACLAVCDEQVRALYYDVEVAFDFLKHGGAFPGRAELDRALCEMAENLDLEQPDGVNAASERLAGLLSGDAGEEVMQVTALGHAHIDLAWLWPVRETVRKGARTFATTLELLERYPEYRFMLNQPQLLSWVRQRYPGLYRRLMEFVARGCIGVEGAFWVEPDAHMPSGESLVRQMIHGQRYCLKEFGQLCKSAWLPDTFGFNAALPQLLRQAGIELFATMKLAWNTVTRFPHQAFWWEGIDGTRVLAHLIPEDTYNGPALPRSLAKIRDDYVDGDKTRHALMCFGIGDGGGGPGAEHLERLRRAPQAGNMPVVRHGVLDDFLDDFQKDAHRFSVWRGELYLERHQGTLTTQAEMKRLMRRVEHALHRWEWTSIAAERPIDRKRWDACWQEVLLYQFHDILPGSSIPRVYEETLPRLRTILEELDVEVQANCGVLAERVSTRSGGASYLVINGSSWDREEWVQVGDGWRRIAVPAYGCAVVEGVAAVGAGVEAVDDLRVGEREIENAHLRVQFDAEGLLTSVYDKNAGRETLAPNARGNELLVYHDGGDAWDFPADYRDQKPERMTLASYATRVEGHRAVAELVFRHKESELRQRMVLASGDRVLAFETEGTWRTPRSMLRVGFPVAVEAEAATYEIQFGWVRRSTGDESDRERAQIEVAGQRWADLTGVDYGVALFNDCKYGHRIKGNVIELNLLRSVPYPGPYINPEVGQATAGATGGQQCTDLGEHCFRYGIYPHAADVGLAAIRRVAAAFDEPLVVHPVSGGGASTEAALSFFGVARGDAVIETVKPAEDGDAVVLRIFDPTGMGGESELRVGDCFVNATGTDLLERAQQSYPLENGRLCVVFKPFEVKTIRLTRK